MFVSHSNGAHGAELCLAETVKALHLRGWSNVYVALRKGGGYLEDLLKQNGAHIIYINPAPWWVDKRINLRDLIRWIRASLTAFFQFFKVLRTVKPDVVISNTIVCNVVYATATKLYGSRHVWYIQELGDVDHGLHYYFGKKTTWFLVKLLSYKIIINSEFTRNYFEGKSDKKTNQIKVIYYAVTIDRLKEQDSGFDQAVIDKWTNFDGTWKILVAGRTVEGKGQEDIIEALGMLKVSYEIVNFRLTILGQVAGSYYDRLLALIAKYDLSENVSIIPFTSEASLFFKEAHIGVTTSRNEAFGRVTVEYMKSNMIVVGAEAGATSEIIIENINGYKYHLGDIKHFSEILRMIMSDAKRLGEFSAIARNSIESRFNIETHGMEIENFLLDR